MFLVELGSPKSAYRTDSGTGDKWLASLPSHAFPIIPAVAILWTLVSFLMLKVLCLQMSPHSVFSFDIFITYLTCP